MAKAFTANAWAPRALAALRIVAGVLFLAHGVVKLFGFPEGGALLVLGLFTRPVAFLLSGEMAVAYWLFHAPKSVYPVLNGGDAAILFCFIFLYIACAGPGAWAVSKR